MSTPGTGAAEGTQTSAALHMGIAEQGKVHALRGDHAVALLYYRHAIHMTVQTHDARSSSAITWNA